MTNRCLPLSIYAAPFMPRHAANEIKQAGIGKRLGSGGPSGLSANSMRSAPAMLNVSQAREHSPAAIRAIASMAAFWTASPYCPCSAPTRVRTKPIMASGVTAASPSWRASSRPLPWWPSELRSKEHRLGLSARNSPFAYSAVPLGRRSRLPTRSNLSDSARTEFLRVTTAPGRSSRQSASAYPAARGGRRRSWNQARYSAIFARCADGACRLHVDASSLLSGAPHLSSTQSFGLYAISRSDVRSSTSLSASVH